MGDLGLSLSAGKTIVNRSIFSLNSAFFDAQSRRVREIPIIRASMLVPSEGPPTGKNFATFIRGWKLDSRRLVGGLWLRAHAATIRATGRSVWRLGIPADPSQLHTAGLVAREAFFCGKFSSVPESPLPPTPHDFSDPRRGKEWSFVHEPTLASAREVSAWDDEHAQWCVSQAWEPVERAGCAHRVRRWETWWTEVKASGFESAWSSWRLTAKRARSLCPSLGLSLRQRAVVPPARGVWIPADIVPQYRLSRPGVGRS